MRSKNNVKALRRAVGWSQADLSARIGITIAAISRIERGETFAKPQHRVAMAEAFGAHPSAVFPPTELDPAAPAMPAELADWRAPGGAPAHKTNRAKAAA